MPDIWLPGYRRVDLGLAGGTYLDTGHPKLLWHTTEGSSVAGARSAFAAYPPHVCYDPRTDEAEQYIPLNRSAYACKANDREYVIQVEVVGFAGSSHTWTAAMLERLGRRVVAPITAAVGVAQAVCSHGFRGEGEGIILASPNSPIRLSLNQLRAFSGHLGHQHMPSPDAHWDPGRLPIDEILSYAEEDDMAGEGPNILAATMTGGASTRNIKVGADGKLDYPPGVDPTSVLGRVADVQVALTRELPFLRAQVTALTAAVAALSNDTDLTADQVSAIVRDAVQQSIQITGTVEVVGATNPGGTA